MVLIDGNGAIFLPSLIAEGIQGAQEAASRLTKGIESYVRDRQFALRVHVFIDMSDLIATLERHGYSDSAAKFTEFLVGFNTASCFFCMVDVGGSMTHNKMRGALLFLP